MNIFEKYNQCILNQVKIKNFLKVNSQIINKFNDFGIINLKDLLLYLPVRYENKKNITSIKFSKPGEDIIILGEITKTVIKNSKTKILECYVQDNTGIVVLRFFYFKNFFINKLIPGKKILVYGKIRIQKYMKEIVHPKFYFPNNKKKIRFNILPVYSKITGISQHLVRNSIKIAISVLSKLKVQEVFPDHYKQEILSLSTALKIVHNPKSEKDLHYLRVFKHPAQIRLIKEELLAYITISLLTRNKITNHISYPLSINHKMKADFLSSLNFLLTESQKRVLIDIDRDLRKNSPMIRLIQGELGSGKTLIAAFASLYAISSGKQVAFMAPTELLARQHKNTFHLWFNKLNIKVVCILGNQNPKERKYYQHAISAGKVNIIIGTHALFQKEIKFCDLALIIIDEQHRFGVHQRLKFWEKGFNTGVFPHQLIMTATPIPRTLSMIKYLGIQISFIKELPKGRKPVVTVIISHKKRNEIIKRMYNMCINENRQVYWVCTLIKESNLSEVQSVEIVCQELKKKLPNIKIDLIHGKIKITEKMKIIDSFRKGIIKILVTTTIIEVGMDIPNASIMIIENSERLGLIQLHQLRGRIGRGFTKSYCILLYKEPITLSALSRLKIIKYNQNSSTIANKDLEIRGKGKILGTNQTGKINNFVILNLDRDKYLISNIKNLAEYILINNPNKVKILISRWISKDIKYILV